MEEDMKSRILVKAGTLALAALAVTASLQIASPVQADNQPALNHRTNSAVFGMLSHVPLQCKVGGGGDVAVSVRVYNTTQSMIPAGKTVSWTVLKEDTGAKQSGSSVLKQNLPPQQSAYVGYTLLLSNQVCTAGVKL
jgi:hypothetical protein